MINLIPNQEKKKMVRDFYYRFVILFLLMLSAAALVATAALLPAYFLSVSKNNIVDQKLEAQKKEPAPASNGETLAMIKGLNLKLNLIENAQKEKFTVSDRVVKAVILEKVPGISITQISYDSDPTKGKKISMSGEASSREVLLAFRQALEQDPTFKSVILPISNFVKGTDIQFSLSLVPVEIK